MERIKSSASTEIPFRANENDRHALRYFDPSQDSKKQPLCETQELTIGIDSDEEIVKPSQLTIHQLKNDKDHVRCQPIVRKVQVFSIQRGDQKKWSMHTLNIIVGYRAMK